MKNEEEELEALAEEEKHTQDIADAEYSTAVTNMNKWKDEIVKLGQQSDTLLLIMEDMSSKRYSIYQYELK